MAWFLLLSEIRLHFALVSWLSQHTGHLEFWSGQVECVGSLPAGCDGEAPLVHPSVCGAPSHVFLIKKGWDGEEAVLDGVVVSQGHGEVHGGWSPCVMGTPALILGPRALRPGCPGGLQRRHLQGCRQGRSLPQPRRVRQEALTADFRWRALDQGGPKRPREASGRHLSAPVMSSTGPAGLTLPGTCF